ncbi:regulatory protein RecX [Rhodovibrionaceae bacterium A322]
MSRKPPHLDQEDGQPITFERLNDPAVIPKDRQRAERKRPAPSRSKGTKSEPIHSGSSDGQESFFLPPVSQPAQRQDGGAVRGFGEARGKKSQSFKTGTSKTRKAKASPTSGSGRKEPKKATPQYLERYALWYLERYASSCENLRRSLRRKVALSARAHGTDPQEGEEAIESLIDKLRRIGALNDEVYARGRVQTLHRRGASERAIRQKLAAKGLGEQDISKALEELREEQRGDPEMLAALAYTRRRRLGPYRPEDKREGLKERDMAALARQGFSYDLVRRIMEAGDLEDLEALADEAQDT